jgi:uncharacterized protein (DUF779 family)
MSLMKKKAKTYAELSDAEKEKVTNVEVIEPLELENTTLNIGDKIKLNAEYPDFLVGEYEGKIVYISDVDYDALKVLDEIELESPLERQGKKVVVGGVVALVGDKLLALEDIEGFNIYKKGQELKVLQSTDDAIQVDDGIHKSWIHKSKFDKLQKLAIKKEEN